MHNFPECPEMAPEDDVDLIEAVVTCEGNLHDADFSERFQILLGNLKSILYKSREDELLKVKKIEPWNSVRITISIPKEAAQKLRLLAQQGSHVLKSLGILTVQVEGDQVISLTLAGQNNEPTEIVLRQSDGSSTSSSSPTSGGGFLLPTIQSPLPIAPVGPNVPLAILSPSPSAFRSPNVVAPAGKSIPVLPPKSVLVNPRPSTLGGPFPFASMTHAAQTMQRTDSALQQNPINTNNSNPVNSNNVNNNNNNNNNNNAVNSTNFPSIPSPASSASPVTSHPTLQTSVSSISTPNVNSVVVSNSSSVSSPSLLLTQQQGLIKSSEQVSRFVLQQQQGGSNSTQSSHASPQSQSLQLQIVNAPPPYPPGVNMNISSSGSSSSSNPSGNLFNSVVNNVNHHHHQQQQQQQQQQLNSANNNNNNNANNDTNYVTVSSPSLTFVGAPPSSSVSSNVNLVRSVSSPSMSSQPQLFGDSLIHHGGVQQQQQQQPMSSPLLVNLLQNNDAVSLQNQSATSQQQQQQQQQGLLNIMLPPSTFDQQKRLILHQQLQQRKMKRGLSLDGAGETGLAGMKSAGELIRPLSAGGSSEPTSSANIIGSSSQMDSNTLTQITLPSSLSSSSLESRIAVGQPRPSSDLSTTATIIQGRAIIHQGNVRVFNSGQIRAIRLTQANTSSPSSSTIHFIQGKPVMTMTSAHGDNIGNSVILNGPHSVMSPSSQNPSLVHQQQFPISSSTISTTPGASTLINNQQQQQQQAGINKHEPNVVYSADQSSRTFNMNPPSSTIVSTSSASNLSFNNSSSSNSISSNTFIPPSEPLSSSLSLPNHHHHLQRLSQPSASTTVTQQERQNVVQSHEAKSIPSQQQHQRSGLIPKLSKESIAASHSPSQLTSSGKPRQLLINPLTGHLEPMPSESSSDSDEEPHERRKPLERSRLGSSKGVGNVRGGTVQHRQIVTTTTTGVTVARVVKSSVDSQRLALEACAAQAKRERQQQQHPAAHHNRLTVVPVTISSPTTALVGSVPRKSREEGVVMITPKDKEVPSVQQSTLKSVSSSEKIKLRLKLEKSEPISPAYKVDVSFVKKSEKSSMSSSSPTSSNSSTTTTMTNTNSPIAPIGSPGEQQPRVPPLHISIRGKNSAVVVSSPRREDDNSSSPINFNDGKPVHLSTSLKSGKRTKSRVKSSGGDISDPESGNRHMKFPSKLSRPRLSKDSCTISNETVDELSLNSHEEPLFKARLDSSSSSTSSITAYPSFSMPSSCEKLTAIPVSTYSGSVKDLISLGSNINNNTAVTPSSIPTPTVKLKKNRRKSEPEPDTANRLLQLPKSLETSSSEFVPTLSNAIIEESIPTLPESSLLFQHLSKKDESPTVSVAVTVSQTVTTLTTSATAVSFPSILEHNLRDQILNTVTTTSVLTLTSTVTGASVATLSQGVSVSGVSKTIPSPLPAVSVYLSAVATTDTNTPSSTITQMSTGYTENIPKLNRENAPKELDLAEVNPGAISIPDGKVVTTPTSKSPKPLPDLLALPTTLGKPPSSHPPNSLFNESGPILLPTSVTINKVSTHLPVQNNTTIISRVPPTSCESIVLTEKETVVTSVTAQPPPPHVAAAVGLKIPTSSDGKVSTLASESKCSPQLIIHNKQLEKYSVGSAGATSGPQRTKGSPPTSVLRPKIQAPRVSIGTSIDSDLPSLTPSPSLKELLEKEKSISVAMIKEAVSNNSDNIKTIRTVVEVEKSSSAASTAELGSLSVKVVNCEASSDMKVESAIVMQKTEVQIDSQPVVQKLAENALSNKESALSKPVICVANKIDLDDPLPSTVIPNAPLPFPLVLPKGDEHNTGAPGEDSGIDSMDALSEKSPNQGESPARKEIEQFGESQQSVPHYCPTTCAPPQHQYSNVTTAPSVENQVQLLTQTIQEVVQETVTVSTPIEVKSVSHSKESEIEKDLVMTTSASNEESIELTKVPSEHPYEMVLVDSIACEEVVSSQPELEVGELDSLVSLNELNPIESTVPLVQPVEINEMEEKVENVNMEIEEETVSPLDTLATLTEKKDVVEHDILLPPPSEPDNVKMYQSEPPYVVETLLVQDNDDQHNTSLEMQVDSIITVSSEELPPVSEIECIVSKPIIESATLEHIVPKLTNTTDTVEKQYSLSNLQEISEITENLKQKSEAETCKEEQTECSNIEEKMKIIESETTNVLKTVDAQAETDFTVSQVDSGKLESPIENPELQLNEPIVTNHIDAIQELNQQAIKQHHTEVIVTKKEILLKKDNVKVRKAKLENIVAAIGTKNIERQQQVKTETLLDCTLTTEVGLEEPFVKVNDELPLVESINTVDVPEVVVVPECQDTRRAYEQLPEIAHETTVKSDQCVFSEVVAPEALIRKYEQPVSREENPNITETLIENCPKEKIEEDVIIPAKELVLLKSEVKDVVDPLVVENHMSQPELKGLPEPENPEQLEPKCLPKTSIPIVVHQALDSLTVSLCTSDSQKKELIIHDIESDSLKKLSGKEESTVNPNPPQNITNTITPIIQLQKQDVDVAANSEKLIKQTLSPIQTPAGVKSHEKNELLAKGPETLGKIDLFTTDVPSQSVISNTTCDSHVVMLQSVSCTPGSQPPPISIVLPSRAKSPPKSDSDANKTAPKLKPRAKFKTGVSTIGGRRIPDGPPKLSKATETDPRPESANPPRLEMRKVEEPVKVGQQQQQQQQQRTGTPPGLSVLPTLTMSPKIQIHGVVPNQQQQQQPLVNVTLAAAQRTLANMIQLSKTTFTQSTINKIPMGNAISNQQCTGSSAIPSAAMGSITVPLQGTATSSTTLGGPGQTVYAIHPNVSLPANLSHLQSHAQSAITVLPGGQKIVPLKLVTIPRQATGQFQTIPLTSINPNRASPNLLEAVNLVANAGSRSNSPKTINIGSSLQTSGPINLSTVSLAGGGNIHLVPISMASTGIGGSSNPVKVLVSSSPIKINQQQSMHQPRVMKSVVMGQQGSTTIRVVRPLEPMQIAATVANKPEHQKSQNIPTPTIMHLQGGISTATVVPPPLVSVVEETPILQHTIQPSILAQSTLITVSAPTTTQGLPPSPITSTSPLISAPSSAPTLTEASTFVSTPASKIPLRRNPEIIADNKPIAVVEKSHSIFKHVDGLEILDAGLPQMNDDDLPFEADIIHDEKDLEDVLAGESVETIVQENGIDGLDSPYDFAIEEKKATEKSPGSYTSGMKKHDTYGKAIKMAVHEHINCSVSQQQHQSKVYQDLSNEKDEVDFSPDSPIPVMRSSSPLYTYGNRSSRNSRPSTRSPSPTESDVHGEDQEIIDSFTRSPSQPKLSPQNNPLPENDEDDDGSPRKPDLMADNDDHRGRTLNQELSIEIPPVDLIVMSPSQQHQQQPEERKSTRSTRSNTRLVSPDITAFRSDTPKLSKFSSKPDPLILRNSPKPSPTGSLKVLSPTVSGLVITPSSSNRSSPILPNQTIAVNANHVNSISSGIIDKITSSSRGLKGGGGTTKRKRQESDSSSASKDENNEDKIEIDLNSRPGKRRCSENAAELIKACIGIEDTPKRNSMLIKRMEESKLKEAKLKKAMATLIEEKEDDNESVESVLSRGRGRSSRASSEDRSSSRGSSVHRNSGSSKSSSKDEEHSKEIKLAHKANNRAGKEKSRNNTEQQDGSNHNISIDKVKKEGIKNIRMGITKRFIRGPLSKEKSPLAPAKTRTNVRKEIAKTGIEKSGEIPTSGTTTTASPEMENLRRKTRSSAAVETSDTDLSSLKRRRISKDAKS